MNYRYEFKNIKYLFLKKENFAFGLIAILIFSLDRFSKIKILNEYNDKTYFINDFINLDLIWNTGIGFGLLSNDSFLIYNLISFTIGIVIVILIYVMLLSKNLDKIIYSIIIGGASGNFYDRLVYNAVPDFIDLHYYNFHWFVFNVADIFITIGIMILLISGIFKNN
tara:strand:+ start:1734 stop:2234 length:501 start_codon:yes stop_codon:yes gene_type:complete